MAKKNYVKTLRIILFLFNFLYLSLFIAGAQVIPAEIGTRASAKITGTIVSPIGIIKVKDMSFGKIVSGNAGTVQLNPEGDFPLTTGEVALQTINSVFAAAELEVNDGLNNSPTTQHFFTGYSITLPTNDITMVNELGNTMRVSNFISSPSASGYGNFTNGKGILKVGATLYVQPFQGLGKYVSVTPFAVTVNFY